jgi:hypothetical protein
MANLILVDANVGFDAEVEQRLRDYIESNIRTPAQ